MAKYSVKFDGLKAEISGIDNVRSRVKSINGSIRSASGGISGTIRNCSRIGTRLSGITDRLDTVSRRLDSMSQALQNVTGEYTSAETTVLEGKYEDGWTDEAIAVNPQQVLDDLILPGILPINAVDTGERKRIIDLLTMPHTFIPNDTQKWLSEFILAQPTGWIQDIAKDVEKTGVDDDSFLAAVFDWKFGKDDKNLLSLFGVETAAGSAAAFIGRLETENFTGYLGKLTINEKTKSKSKYEFKGVEKAIEKWGEKNDLYVEDKVEKYYDQNGKEISKKEGEKKGFMKRQATLYEWEDKATIEASLFEGDWDTKIGKVSAKVGSAEAHAALSAGFYVVGADGKRKFSPGVKAEVGASVTGLEIGLANGAIIGNEMLGLNGEAKLTVAKAEAKGSATLQIYGEDGKLKPQLDVGVKAEANLVEVEGSVGVNVLGGEVKAKGTFSVGAGAHANVGYKDGVFKLDIGASLGVGGSIKIEADLGGMVDTVVGAGKAVVNTVSNAYNGVKSAVGKVFSWFS